MPFDYTIDSKNNVAVFRAIGICDVESWIETVNALSADPHLDLQTKLLFDTSPAFNAPTIEDSRIMTERIFANQVFENRQIAVVAPDPLIFGMNRMIAARAEANGFEVMVFKSMYEALGWLNCGALSI